MIPTHTVALHQNVPWFTVLTVEPRGPRPADALPGPAVTVTVDRAMRAAVTPLAGAARHLRVPTVARGAPTEGDTQDRQEGQHQ